MAGPGLFRLEPWQRSRLALVVTVAACFLGLEFSSSFMPLYIRYLGVADVGEAALWSGLVVGVAPLAAAIMAPVWGGMADRYGRKRMVVRAMIAISLLSLAMAAAPNVIWAFVIRLVMGLTSGFTGMVMALAVSVSPRERTGQTVGMMQAAQLLPLAVGPPIGGAISDLFGLRTNFLLTGLVVGLAILVLLVLFGEEKTHTPTVTPGPRKKEGRWGMVGLPGFAATMGLVYLVQFVDRSLPPILPLYLGQIDTPTAQLATISGLVVASGAVAAGTSATLYGRLVRPGRTAALLAIALAGGMLCVGPIGLAGRWEQVLVLRLMMGLLAGGSLAMGYTLGTSLVPAERTGLALGVLSSAAMFGSASAPFLAGIVGRFNLRAVFAVDVACYALAILVVLFWLRRADRAPVPAPAGT